MNSFKVKIKVVLEKEYEINPANHETDKSIEEMIEIEKEYIENEGLVEMDWDKMETTITKIED